MTTHTVEIEGLDALRGNLRINIPKQIQFATMQTVNDCALAVQKFEIRSQLPSVFTLRTRGSPWWKPGTRFGVNVRFATKQTLKSIVGSRADWLLKQEEGGTKTGKGHRLAIEAGARPSESSVLTAALKPRQLLRRRGDVSTTRSGKSKTARSDGRGFIIQTKSGPAIFTRQGGALKLMYMLENSAKIPAILNFYNSGKDLVVSIYSKTFNQRFRAAVATARPE